MSTRINAEDTLLSVIDGELRGHAQGNAYRAQRHQGHLAADIFQAGAVRAELNTRRPITARLQSMRVLPS